MNFPVGQFPVITADPPWSYSCFSATGEERSASKHYKTMDLEEIKALPVSTISARDCHLFMWTTGPNLRQAFEVMDAWGFEYSSIAFTWVKLNRSSDRSPRLFMDGASFHVGMGHTTRKNTEMCLLGRKGSPRRRSASVRELLIAPVREHSRKPDEVYERIEQYAEGPFLELFARTSRGGQWTSWGNETGKFSGRSP